MRRMACKVNLGYIRVDCLDCFSEKGSNPRSGEVHQLFLDFITFGHNAMLAAPNEEVLGLSRFEGGVSVL